MVARINMPCSLQKALNYNEQKVRKGTAACIGENGFLLPLTKMNFYDKQEVFEYRNRLNERATTKTFHVSLNFSVREAYDAAFLMQVARDYMERIGFAEQPYLVYHHYDAGHPHIHILSTTIQADGKRINTHNIGREKSEPARKLIEEKYGLVKAEMQIKENKPITPVDTGKLIYGKTETRRGIASVLHQVINRYNYTSLPELNAVLKQFNVLADRGEEGSFVHSKNGLYYRLLDTDGNKIGVPVKASKISPHATLSQLYKKFERNSQLREPFKLFLKNKIDKVLLDKPQTISALAALLVKENIVAVTRQNAEGKMYGITFIDNEHHAVLNGSDIGRQYSVGGLLKQMSNSAADNSTSNALQTGQKHQGAETGLIEFNGLAAIDALVSPENEWNNTPYHLKRRKRKQKR